MLAFHGKYAEAAKIYKRLGLEHRALTMYTDLRMFDLANEFLSAGDDADRKGLIKKIDSITLINANKIHLSNLLQPDGNENPTDSRLIK